MSDYKFDRLKIMIVDDNIHLRKMLSAILQAFGATAIYEMPNGLQAWKKLSSINPDIVFLDWMMPEMTGIEFVKLVRTSDQSPNPFLPIIMLTGYTQLEHVQKARDSGITEFLAKPISAKGVLARITSVIESPRSFVRTSNYFGPCRRRRVVDEYQGPERRASDADGPLAGGSEAGGFERTAS